MPYHCRHARRIKVRLHAGMNRRIHAHVLSVRIIQGLPDQWNTLLKHSKITEEDAAKNPQAVLDVLQFFTEQAKDDSGHFEVGDVAEQQKDWVAPLQQPKPKPSQSSPTPRRVKTPPIEAPPAKKKVVPVNEQPTIPDENTQPVRFHANL